VGRGHTKGTHCARPVLTEARRVQSAQRECACVELASGRGDSRLLNSRAWPAKPRGRERDCQPRPCTQHAGYSCGRYPGRDSTLGAGGCDA
jgi:hypothetical protein